MDGEPYQVCYAVVCIVLPIEAEGNLQIISYLSLSPVHTCNNNTVSVKVRKRTTPYIFKMKLTDVNVAFAVGGVSGGCQIRRCLSVRENCRIIGPCLQFKTHLGHKTGKKNCFAISLTIREHCCSVEQRVAFFSLSEFKFHISHRLICTCGASP